jgi:tetratricopeptide (TPR) repeat protein
LPTGTIRLITTKEEPKFHYHNEVKCRHCGNTDVHMGMKDWAGVVLRSMTSVQLPGEEIMVVGRTGFLEEKRMPMEEMMPFMESRISDEPDNWELWLRYGNLISGIMNDYEKATEAWERATKLNPKSIAPYMRLGETYFNRWKIYNEKGAKKKARDYLSMALVAIKENGDSATIENDPSELTDIVAGMINELGCANSGIYVAPMEEVAKPLSEHVSDNPNISMSRVEKSTGFMRAALINFIYEYPDVKKDSLVSMIKNILYDFDGKKEKKTAHLRDLIKLNILAEKKKPGNNYSKQEVLLGLGIVADVLENDESFDEIKNASKSHLDKSH